MAPKAQSRRKIREKKQPKTKRPKAKQPGKKQSKMKPPKNIADIIMRALDFSTDGIIIGGLDGIVLYHNKAWLRIHALDENIDMRGKRFRDYERPELLPILDKVVEELGKHGSYTYQFGTVRRDGVYHDVHLAANVIRECDPPVVLVILREVTDRVQMETEIARRNVELALFNEIYGVMTKTRSRKTVIRGIMKLLGDYIGALSCGFYLIDPAQKNFVLLDSIGLPRSVKERVIHIPLRGGTDRAFERIAKSRRTFVLEEDMPEHAGEEADIREAMGIKRTIATVFRTSTARSYMAIFGLPEAKSVGPAVRSFFDAAAKQFGVAIERAELFEELEKRGKELNDLMVRLIDSGEEEKRRCSLMLHDEVGQALTALKLELEMLEKNLGSLDPCARKSFEGIRRQLRFVSEGTRSLSKSLHPAMLDELGLGPTITWYLDTFVRSEGIEAEFTETGCDEHLPEAISLTLYRVALEAITNALKHAGASKITISLIKGYPYAIMEIEDNGKGISSEKGKTQPRGLGLVSMRERVELQGGAFQVKSSSGKGTKIRVKIPIEARSE